MAPHSKLIRLVALLTAALAAGTLGYRLIMSWGWFDSLYMTVITLATVGYGEVHQLTPEGRAFTIVLILSGMGIILYTVTELTTLVLEGELTALIRNRRIGKVIDRLKNHYIVCGAGRNGTYVIEELQRTKRQCVVIDHDSEKAQLLRRSGVLCVEGDATDDQNLQAAGIGKAAGIVCALPTDRDNLFVVISARGLNPSLRIISKIDDIKSREKFLRSGADSAVSPNFIGGLRMASELVRPETATFLDQMLRDNSALRVEDLKIHINLGEGTAIESCDFLTRSGVLLLAVRRSDGFTFNPPKSDLLKAGDTLVVIGTPDQLEIARAMV